MVFFFANFSGTLGDFNRGYHRGLSHFLGLQLLIEGRLVFVRWKGKIYNPSSKFFLLPFSWMCRNEKKKLSAFFTWLLNAFQEPFTTRRKKCLSDTDYLMKRAFGNLPEQLWFCSWFDKVCLTGFSHEAYSTPTRNIRLCYARLVNLVIKVRS